jgi:hypothetical protein
MSASFQNQRSSLCPCHNDPQKNTEPGTAEYTCNLSTWEDEAGGSHKFKASFDYIVRPCFKKKKKKKEKTEESLSMELWISCEWERNNMVN